MCVCVLDTRDRLQGLDGGCGISLLVTGFSVILWGLNRWLWLTLDVYSLCVALVYRGQIKRRTFIRLPVYLSTFQASAIPVLYFGEQ